MSSVGVQSVDDWVQERQATAPLCACGCGMPIRIRPDHKKRGVPRFLHGHHNRVSARAKSSELTAWMEQEQGKHVCGCGCGQAITIRRHHRKAGIPRFGYGHGLKGLQNHNYRGVDVWVLNQQGQHFCACGCGETIKVLDRHHAVRGIPRFIPGHQKRAKGPESPKYQKDRSKLKAGRGGKYFYASLRRAILDRDGHRCVRCGSDDRVSVDHIVPVAKGGPGEMSNGQTLCHACHVGKTRIERGQLKLRRLCDQVELNAFRLLFQLRKILRGLETRHDDHR